MSIDLKFKAYAFTSWHNKLLPLLLYLSDSSIPPDFWGKTERSINSFTSDLFEDMVSMWHARQRICYRKKKAYVMPLEFWERYDIPSELTMLIQKNYFASKEADNILAFCDFVYYWGDIDYAYFTHWNDFQQKNKLDKVALINGNHIMVGGQKINSSLPGIYWLNYFGPRIVRRVGEERFVALQQETPVRTLDNGGYVVQVGESAFDYNDPKVKIKSSEVIECIGISYFFEKDNPTKLTKSLFAHPLAEEG